MSALGNSPYHEIQQLCTMVHYYGPYTTDPKDADLLTLSDYCLVCRGETTCNDGGRELGRRVNAGIRGGGPLPCRYPNAAGPEHLTRTGQWERCVYTDRYRCEIVHYQVPDLEARTTDDFWVNRTLAYHYCPACYTTIECSTWRTGEACDLPHTTEPYRSPVSAPVTN